MSLQESKGIVMVVDDSVDALNILNETLITAGYTVFVAMDGKQALEIAGRLKPDLILMDAIMPNMDGFESCKQIKKNTELCDIPVIFMTGLSDSEHVIKGLEAGGVDYLNKPVNLSELLARIRVHLNNSRLTRSARGALDEIGQLTFSCDINGQILWSTDSARASLANLSTDTEWLHKQLVEQICAWLSRNPVKQSTLWLKDLEAPVQLRFLGRPTPGEYLLRLQNDDELSVRAAFCNQFLLTGREAEVLFWLVQGKTNREIAQILSMSPRTVNKHLEPIYRKLEVENRTSATAVCLAFLNSR